MRLAHFQFDPETDRLGEGPLSEVYKAVDLQLGRTVALKVLRPHAEIDPQADTRFHREARHTSALEHPNITTIYEYGHDQGTSFIAMEYLRGRTLDKIIKDQSLGYEGACGSPCSSPPRSRSCTSTTSSTASRRACRSAMCSRASVSSGTCFSASPAPPVHVMPRSSTRARCSSGSVVHPTPSAGPRSA
jgi:serine/threonine protein kinase